MTTVEEIISRVDRLRPNPFSNEQKLTWLSLLDGIIYREIISLAVENDVAFTYHSDIHDELLVDKPFDELYVLYLFAQIDLYLGESANYDMDITAFQDYFNSFCGDYERNHKMKTSPKICF